jgi:AraC-like DNA-binding protein
MSITQCKSQQQTLSIRVSESLREFLELSRQVIANGRGDVVSIRAIATLGDQSHRTAKAIAWITANYARPLRVEERAEIAGMAASTLHHHFRALTAMSPLQFQKQVRLQAARARMLADDVDAATVAYEAGYESASQFNRGSPGAPRLESAAPVQPRVQIAVRTSLLVLHA